jgi:hypothetical protein
MGETQMNKITRDDTEHGVEYVRADEAQAEVLEQCRIIAMGAEREDALRAELTRLKASIALDKKAENARELGLDYEPARQDVPETNFGNMAHPDYAWPTIEQRAVIQQMVDALDHADELLGGNDTLVMNGAAAGRWLLEQPAVQEGRDWSLLEATQESLREHMAEIKRLKAAQPVPVKTYHGGKPWPVQPKPWVGLTDEEAQWIYDNGRTPSGMMEMVEAKLKEKNT